MLYTEGAYGGSDDRPNKLEAVGGGENNLTRWSQLLLSLLLRLRPLACTTGWRRHGGCWNTRKALDVCLCGGLKIGLAGVNQVNGRKECKQFT